MPELPEVETIARSLARDASIDGRTIRSCDVRWERTIAFPSVATFKRRIQGQTVCSLGRCGKYLVITLDKDTLLMHLRMSGDLRFEKTAHTSAKTISTEKHDRLLIFFEDGACLVFNDTRKFGRVWLLPDPQVVLRKIGPDALDEQLTPALFYEMLQSKKRQLKPLLMDQHFLAGLGNIYTDEALYLAKLHPLQQSDDISAEQAALLLRSIRAVLREGIRRNGASIDWVYRGGDFQNHFCVYGRAGEPCFACGQPIQRLLVGQRGTHICPHCQQINR